MPAPQVFDDMVADNFMEFDEGSGGPLIDAQNEKLVHNDFYDGVWQFVSSLIDSLSI